MGRPILATLNVGTEHIFKSNPTLSKDRSPTLTDMMKFVSEWFYYEENTNNFCDTLSNDFTKFEGGGQLTDSLGVTKGEAMDDQCGLEIFEEMQSEPNNQDGEIGTIGTNLEI
ncbi:hypothetical protein L484_022260 [Morus notabilis]|uniref:Uncharacterized protein n=1 Tax=Morus notabilis TaxID=981085 RepID=W9SUR0_9ROSA|nr:hypothetical protein L484_022260 [Morus notabilis]